MLLRGTMGIGAVIAIAMFGGCGGDGSSGEATESTAPESDGSSTISSRDGRISPAPPPKCRPAEISKAKTVDYGAPAQTVAKGDKLTAVVRTNCGTFSIALDARRFPTTVNSFVFLAKHHFYDGLPFDKAGAGVYLHGGDPPGKATGPGYTVDERVSFGFVYRHGVVAMAQPGQAPNGQAGSQFLVVLAKPWLDFGDGYPPIGVVKRGFDVLNAISHFGPRSRYPRNPGVLGPIGELRRPVVVEDVTVEKD